MATDDTNRPEFRGCVFCYAAEWAYHGLRQITGRTE